MILYVVRYHPALTETFVRDEIRALVAAGVDIELAAFDVRESAGEADPCPVIRKPHRWGWMRELPGLFLEWLRKPGMVSRRVLWLTMNVRRYRRVHVHFAGEASEWTRQACSRAGVPYSLTVHAVDLYKPMASLPNVLRQACDVVAMTSYNQRLLAERYAVVAHLVRFGLNLQPLANRDPPSGKPIVLSVGRNVPKKGLDLVCRVATQLDDQANFVLYSNLPPQDHVVVKGLVPHSEVLAALAGAFLFVLPCRVAPDGDMDGLPVALVEAMAAGVPVVTTSVSGIPELVDNEVGWLIPPDDVDALYAAIRAALDNPAEARRRGAAGRDRVVALGYSRERLAMEMQRILGV